MPWYYERNGQAVGPFDDHEMVRLADSGKIDAISLLSQDGGTTWLSAREAAPLFGLPPERLHSGEAGPIGRCARCATLIPPDEPLPATGEILCERCRRKEASRPQPEKARTLAQRLRALFGHSRERS